MRCEPSHLSKPNSSASSHDQLRLSSPAGALIFVKLTGTISNDVDLTCGAGEGGVSRLVILCSQRLQHQHLNFLLWSGLNQSTGQI